MPIYIINYDFGQPETGKDNKKLQEAIKDKYQHIHFQYSAWLIRTDEPAGQIRDHLSQSLDTNDRIFVAPLDTQNPAAWNAKQEAHNGKELEDFFPRFAPKLYL